MCAPEGHPRVAAPPHLPQDEPVDPGLVRRWIAGQKAAARRSLQALPRLTPDAALRQSFALMELCPGLFAAPPDAVRLREEAAARAAWARVRARLR